MNSSKSYQHCGRTGSGDGLDIRMEVCTKTLSLVTLATNYDLGTDKRGVVVYIYCSSDTETLHLQAYQNGVYGNYFD
jgi:hypothetical protein